MPQSKDTGYQNGLKNKQTNKQNNWYAICKKLILDPKAPPDLKWGGGKQFSMVKHANEHQKRAGLAILISDQLDFKPKTIIRDEEGHYITLKGSNKKI